MKKIWWPSLALLLVACGTDDEDPRSIAGNQYRNPILGITLQFPANWMLKLDQRYGETRIDLAAAGASGNGFSPNANIIALTHQGTTDLNVIMASAKAQLTARFEQNADIAGIKASLIIQ